ncbi:hypothetical protein QTP88_010657 [Uroleucon formosanum]
MEATSLNPLDFVKIKLQFGYLVNVFVIDRLPIIATAPNTEQIFGVPELSAGTGYEVLSAVYDTLEDWSLLHTVHHVFEIILQSVFVGSKFAPSSDPDIPLFKRFKNQWETINLTQFSIWSTDVWTSIVLDEVRQQILIFAHEKLKNDFLRDDYKKFLELVIIYLGDVPPGGIKFCRPGPYHLARWMAKVLYRILVYSPRCSASTTQFIKKLHSYKKDDKIIAEIALIKFLNHLRYLSEECVAFSLFDDRINVKQKRNMVQKILEEDKEEEKEVQKKFYLKSEEVSNFVNNEFPISLFSPKSMIMFKRFGLSTNFLKMDPSEWNTQNDYLHSKSTNN